MMLYVVRTFHFLLVHWRITLLVLFNMVVFWGNWYIYSAEQSDNTLLAAQFRTLQLDLAAAKTTNTTTISATATTLATTNRISAHISSDTYKLKGRLIAKPNPYTITDEENVHGKVIQKPNYDELRKNYQVPNIEYTHLINCDALLQNSTKELQHAKSILNTMHKTPIYEETYLKWVENCDDFIRNRGYITVPLTKEEEDFPLAFSISMYTDVELAERLLRSIYQPQNLYCIHIDIKSPLLIHRTMRSIAKCFNNVFIASHLDKIKWGDVSVLLPALNCMRDFDRYYRGRWKYYINLTGQELPLRSNWEIVQIAKIFNGSNDIAGSTVRYTNKFLPIHPEIRMEMDRVKHKWTHRWSKTYQQTIFYDTVKPKDPPPYNLTFFKGPVHLNEVRISDQNMEELMEFCHTHCVSLSGELHGLFTQRMVSYIVNDDVSKEYLAWCWDSGHPSEHYWNTLNYNIHLKAPGGYQGPMDLAHRYSYNPAIRAKHWQDQNYGTRECQGKLVRGICIYGVGDVPWLSQRLELFANKFHLTFEYLAYDCMEQRHRERTKLGTKVPFAAGYYRSLPTVLYSRKDGYLKS